MLSATQAFRSPDLLDSYFNASIPTTLYGFPAVISILGNKNLIPETVNAYEAEYRYKLSNRVNGKVGAFYNAYSDFIVSANSSDPFNPLHVIESFTNAGKAANIGGEFSINALLTDWLSGMLNYAYSQTEDYSTDIVRQDSPKNTVNATLNARFNNGISGFLGVQWVDSTVFDYENQPVVSQLINMNAYTIINARVGYAFPDKRTEVSLAAFNLFDQNVYEGLPGIGLVPAGQLPTGEELGRRVVAKVSYKF
jgi:outer membrane receptor protein involved in Fe transport